MTRPPGWKWMEEGLSRPFVPLESLYFMLRFTCSKSLKTEELFDFQGRGGVTPVVPIDQSISLNQSISKGIVLQKYAVLMRSSLKMSCFFQARKKSTKIKFLGPETARWGGGLPREGVVAENFVPALETLSSLGFEERNPGCPGNFAGMSRTPGGVQKVCAKKLRAHLSFPNFLEI